MRFRTETGSLYEIDYEKKTWARLEQPRYEGATPLRTKEGTFIEISAPCLGASIRMVCSPYVEGATGRYITTSRVVEIL